MLSERDNTQITYLRAYVRMKLEQVKKEMTLGSTYMSYLLKEKSLIIGTYKTEEIVSNCYFSAVLLLKHLGGK